MTTKKQEAKKSVARKPSIEEKALAIVKDGNHDYDMRREIHQALKHLQFNRDGRAESYGFTADEAQADAAMHERELRELIALVESGGQVEPRGIEPVYVEAARRVLALLYSNGMPDFINDGLCVILTMAEKRFGSKLFLDEIDRPETGGWSVAAMARVFRSHDHETFDIERKRDLADLISAVLNHPDLPVSIYKDLSRAVTSLQNNEAMDSPEVIRALLKANPDERRLREEEENRKGRNAR